MSRCWTILISSCFIFCCAEYKVFAQPPGPAAVPIDSPLAIEPKNDADRLEAAQLMSNLGRYDLAKNYLAQITDQKLSDEQILAIRDQFGTPELFRLSRVTELLPESKTLLDQVIAASKRTGSDPARIDRILADLDKSPRDREFAILELKNIGVIAVPRLLQYLGNPESDQERDRLVDVLVQMGPNILPAIIAALAADDVLLQSGLLEVIGLIGDSASADHLWYYAYAEQQSPAVKSAALIALSRIIFASAHKTKLLSSYGVADKIRGISLAYFQQQYPFNTRDDGKVEIWVYDADQQTVIPVAVSPEAASIYFAKHFSRQLFLLQPDSVESQALHLATIIDDAAYRTGWSAPLPTGPGTAFNLMLTSSLPVVEQVAQLGFRSGRARVAETALTALSLIGDRNQLRHSSGQPSLLVQSLNAADRRIQFAAAVGILKLKPDKPYPQSQRLLDILLQAINDDGQSSLLVIDPNIDRGRGIATAAASLGYVQHVVKTGKQGFQMAADRGDVALLLIHINCIDWELSQTIANLRADARTANLPIAIYGPTYMEDEQKLTIMRTPLSHYVVYSDQAVEIERQLAPFLDRLSSPPLTSAQRKQQTSAAMFWLAEIAQTAPQLYPLERTAAACFHYLGDPQLCFDAISVLSVIPTLESQRMLGDAVLTENNGLEIREQAAFALGRHMQNHGVLIEMEQAAAIKNLWQSESDPNLQTALTAVVGAFGPSNAQVQKRLEGFAAPLLPATN